MGGRLLPQPLDKDLFGGNAGAYKANERTPTGIIKHVYQQQKTEEEIEDEIHEKYPDTECDFFKKKDGEFMGIIKVKFKQENDLNDAITNKITIFQQKYIVEKFKPKPSVI